MAPVADAAPIAAHLEGAPTLGPYCPITGRRTRPWWSTSLWAAFHALSIAAIFVAVHHAHTWVHGPEHPGRSTTIFVGFGIATAVYVTGWFFARLGFATRLLLTAGAISAVVLEWRSETPLGFADPNLAWTLDLDAERERWDAFLAEAGLPPALALFAFVYALLGLVVAVQTVRFVVRSWGLPKRMWFARYHPVWRRRYTPDESAHPIAGVLWVADDELLTDKLVWLASDRVETAIRFAPPVDAADPPAIPLGALERSVVVWRERTGQWHTTDELPDAVARLRLLFAPPGSVRASTPDDPPPPLVVPIEPGTQAVRDLFEEDEGSVAKRYEDPNERGRLFGLLIDSRPARDEDGSFAAVPRFTALVHRGERVVAERPHPDLVGEPHVEGARVLLPWRGPSGEPTTLELDGRTDSVHYVEAPLLDVPDGDAPRGDAARHGDGYWLAFVGFEGGSASR